MNIGELEKPFGVNLESKLYHRDNNKVDMKNKARYT